MKPELNVGEIVTVKRFSFTNTAGGTGMSNWKWDPPFAGEAKVKVLQRWDDYEIGERAICKAVSPDLKKYLKLNASRNDQRVFIGEFDLEGN